MAKYKKKSHLLVFTRQLCPRLPYQYLCSCDLTLSNPLILFSVYRLLDGCPTPDKSHLIYSPSLLFPHVLKYHSPEKMCEYQLQAQSRWTDAGLTESMNPTGSKGTKTSAE